MTLGTAKPKPLKGEYVLERRVTRAKRVRDEQREMQAAKRRDLQNCGGCRWPRCAFRKFNPPIDSCHMNHRGMGGNPLGDRTTRQSCLAMCRTHHSLYDACELDVQPLTGEGTDGLCAFYRRDDSGAWVHVATEQRIGISVTR